MKIGLILAILLAIGAFLLLAQPFVIPTDKVVFLDVGQGDSILFQRGTQQVVVDGTQRNLNL